MNRRTFLKSLAGTAAVAALTPMAALSPKYTMGVDVASGEDCAGVVIFPPSGNFPCAFERISLLDTAAFVEEVKLLIPIYGAQIRRQQNC
ncbi:MAG TPA: twin-arginine translocation signal domain-containing protein [Candidatus Acidoferrales bacterium]|nr:twin-arginine translocation signal domain-containing protein [Candidatus Acidoferrales bacterium]